MDQPTSTKAPASPPAGLNTQPNLAAPDDFYETLINAHEGLDEADSHKMNAMLVLLLANHVGDTLVLQQALQKARSVIMAATENR